MDLNRFFQILTKADFDCIRHDFKDGGLDRDELVANKKGFLNDLDWKVKQRLGILRKEFTDEEIMYGLRLGLGLARGKNKAYHLEGLILLRYREESGYEMQVTGANIREAVREAGKLAGQVSERLTVPDELLLAALAYHFKIKASETENVGTIRRNFETVRQGLSAQICIADTDHRSWPHSGYSGYVGFRTKKDYHAAHGPDLSPFASPGRGLMPDDPLKTEQDVVATSIHVDYTLFGEAQKKAGLANFSSDEEGQKRKAEHDNYARLFSTSKVRQILILHEATHKFCFTADHCYCKEENRGKYEALRQEMLMKNADSYAYLALSVLAGRLIEVREQAHVLNAGSS